MIEYCSIDVKLHEGYTAQGIGGVVRRIPVKN